ncbi:MAG: hypothetical protein O3C43_11485 [Verrucomicrobia bacterium]|nr:hypothetical protein [Verrucomicrobiota bacterium]MDA1067115.1 hypothetical protein [Verrucomicrobiota bacterium]
MPSFKHHPLGLDPYLVEGTPFDDQLIAQGLPDRATLLLALLGDVGSSENRLSDFTWLGHHASDFEELFEGTEFEGAFGTGRFLLADHFFPQGGFIGASTVAFPKFLTSAPPAAVGTLLDGGEDFAKLAAAAAELLDYLLTTETVGQLAFYLPAPNPPLAQFPDDFEGLLESFNSFGQPGGPFYGDFYPVDKTFMRGWVDTPLLGVPTGRAAFAYNGDTGVMELTAEIPEDSWFSDLVGEASITLGLEGNHKAVEDLPLKFWKLSAELITSIKEGTATDEERQAMKDDFVAQAITDVGFEGMMELLYAMPKMSAVLNFSELTIPGVSPELPLAKVEGASLEIYSPYFNLAGADGDNPLDRVRREGGIGFSGSLSLGGGLISISEAELAVIGNSVNPLVFPDVIGSFKADAVDFDGINLLPGKGALEGSFMLESGSAMLSIGAEIELIDFAGLQLIPLEDDADGKIGVSLDLEAPAGEWGNLGLSLNEAMILRSHFLGDAVQVVVDPFTFYSDDSWTATAHFDGSGVLELKVGDVVWASVQPAGGDWGKFGAEVKGFGYSVTEFSFDELPLGAIVRFPKPPFGNLSQLEFTVGAGGSASLTLSSEGFSLVAQVNKAFGFDPLGGGVLAEGFMLELTHESLEVVGSSDKFVLAPGVILTAKLDENIEFSLDYTLEDGWDVLMDPAFLLLSNVGVAQLFTIDGGVKEKAPGLLSPFTFSQNDDWTARITLTELTLDADGGGALPSIVTIAPSTGSESLLSATLNGVGTSSLSFEAVRSGKIDLTWFPESALETSMDAIDPGTLTMRLDIKDGFSISVSKPDELIQFPGFPSISGGANLEINEDGFELRGISTSSIQFPATGLNPPLFKIGSIQLWK